jgi:hypothetical protein
MTSNFPFRWIALAVMIAATGAGNTVDAQQGQTGPYGVLQDVSAGNWELGYLFAPDPLVHQLTIERARVFSPGQMMGRVSPESHVTFGHLGAGVRFGPEEDPAFRWRAGVLDADLYGRVLAFGLTAVDYNRAGALETDARWAEVRSGVNLRMEGDGFVFEPRLIGHVGVSSIRPGEVIYGGLMRDADEMSTGVEAGYRASAAVSAANARLETGYGYRALLTGDELRLTTIATELDMRLATGLRGFVRYEREFASTNDFSDSFDLFQTGVRVDIPTAPRQRMRR